MKGNIVLLSNDCRQKEMINMQEVKFSQDTINTEIRVYKEFIAVWEQEFNSSASGFKKI